MLPQFVIIGTQKSASSFLQLCLADHPEIYMPHGEEPFFESPDYETRNIQYLEALFADHQDRLCGIRRPSYLGRSEVPARLKKHLPDAKLLIVFRNPVDRLVSAYYHYMATGFIPVRPIEQGLEDLLDGRYAERYLRAWEITEFGFYAKHLSVYLDLFERRSFFITLHEDIVRNPREVLCDSYKFLGVDSGFVSGRLNSKPQASVYSLPRLRLKQWLNPLFFTYNKDRTRLEKRPSTPARSAVATAYLHLDRGLLARCFPSIPPSLDAGLLSRLRGIYHEDTCRLEKLVNRDLSSWK